MFKKTLVGLALVAPLSAFAAPTTFDNTSLGGSNTFDFTQVQISGGASSVVLTDSNNNGLVDAGDTFVETGFVAGFGFTDSVGNPINNTGLNTTGGYQLFAVFNPLVGAVAFALPGFYQVAFGSASGFTLYYDTDLTAGLQAGATVIGQGTNGSGNCVVSSAIAGGACVLDFDFDAAAVSAAGVFTSGGIDLGLLGASIRVDMNVDNIAPNFFSPTYAVAGGTQERLLDHNGSASFQVPEPSSLALLGLGGLMGLVRRRKAA